jgi:hypothetical protein
MAAVLCMMLDGRAQAAGQRDHSQSNGGQAVLIKLKLAGNGYGTADEQTAVHDEEKKIAAALVAVKGAALDGDEFGDGVCAIYLYGVSADAMFDAIKPVVDDWDALKGGSITKRYGPPKAREVVVKY